MKFEGKGAIVTGSARGIGKGIARGLSREGARVVVSDIDEAAASVTAQAIQEDFKVSSFSLKTDVTKKSDIEALVKHALDHLGEIDFLINNAGIMYQTKTQDLTGQEWDEVMNVNMRSVFFCCQSVSPIMKKQKKGGILNMASIAGKIGGIASGAHYAVSKAGVICLTKIFARELAPFGVRVNALAPGPVNTAIMQSFPPEIRKGFSKNCPLGKVAEIEDIVEASLFLLSDGANHITGEILDINGGLLMD